MKSKSKFLFLIIALGAICLAPAVKAATPQWSPSAPEWAAAGASEDQLWAQTAPSPAPVVPAQPSDIVPGAPAFDTNGLSFTNVSYKIALGTELQNAGTFTYAQGDADLWNLGPMDLGLGAELTFSSQGNGLHSGSIDVEGIKNFSNWQLVGKVGYGRTLEDNAGNYLKLGFDLNYNLSAGTGISFLSTSGGSFTYVGAGVSWENADFSFAQAKTDKMFRIYFGWAF